MPYLNASPWTGLLPLQGGTISASSVPLTLGEVATIIDRTSAEIDSALAEAGYSVPVGGAGSVAPSGYALLEEICNYGAGWKVLRTFFPNAGGPGDNISVAAEYRDAYMAALARIRTGEQPIIGAPLDSSGQGRNLPRSYSTSNPGGTAGVVLLSPDIDYEY